jgi:YD repeat-containing protein
VAKTTSPAKKKWDHPEPLGAELRTLGEEVDAALEGLLAVSEIEDTHKDRELMIIGGNPWKWSRLEDEHLPLLARARDVVARWLDAGHRVLRFCAPEFSDDFVSTALVLEDVIDRSRKGGGPPSSDTAKVLAEIRKALDDQREMLRHAGVSREEEAAELLLIPDTSALYANPSLEEWATDEAATLVLVPQVIRELDKHKVHHPSEDVRKKADSLIRRFDELGRRGDTFEGVKLAGKLKFREVAYDADASELVVGLRMENDDDRLLASALELKWRNPSAAVLLVTPDRNLRNKARITRLATDSPPKPVLPIASPATRQRLRVPEVSIGHAGGQVSTTPLHELKEGEHSRLVRVEPRYPIENKGQTGVWNVTTGVRTRDGREHEFVSYKAQLIGAGEISWVENVGSIPIDFLEGTHESAAFDAFLYWVRFTDADGIAWEVVYDAEIRTTSHRRLTERLRARPRSAADIP